MKKTVAVGVLCLPPLPPSLVGIRVKREKEIITSRSPIKPKY
jgi:anaerobic glycerol-3-phosphate dehydrogenase